MNTMATAQSLELTLDSGALDFTPDEIVLAPKRRPKRPAKARAPRSSVSMNPSLLLRGLGALVIVAAFVLYLFNGWRDSDDLSRCLLLLGHTLALTLAGFASGHWLQESKGARLFIALALAAVPVNVAFLGGLSYPLLTWDAQSGLGAAESIWTSFNGTLALGSVLLLIAVSLLVLAGSAWIGFRVMARHSAGRLTGLYLAANLALLAPTRSDLVISSLLFVFGLGLTLAGPYLRRRDPALSTPEGFFARTLLLLPLVVLGGRSLWLYSPDEVFLTTLCLMLYLAVRWGLNAMPLESGWRAPVQLLALIAAVATVAFATSSLEHIWPLSDANWLPLRASLLAGFLIDLSLVAGKRAGAYRAAAALLVSLALLLNLGLFGGFVQALVTLAAGFAVLGYGYVARQRWLFATGLLTAGAGLVSLASEALRDFSLSGWSALVLIGIAIIIAGSVLERHGPRLRVALSHWRAHFAADQ